MNTKKMSFHLAKGEIFDGKNASVIATVHSIVYSVQPHATYKAHSIDNTRQQSAFFFIRFCSWILRKMFKETVWPIFWSYITHCQPLTDKNKRMQALLHNCNLQWRVAQLHSPKEFQHLLLFLALWIIKAHWLSLQAGYTPSDFNGLG